MLEHLGKHYIVKERETALATWTFDETFIWQMFENGKHFDMQGIKHIIETFW